MIGRTVYEIMIRGASRTMRRFFIRFAPVPECNGCGVPRFIQARGWDDRSEASGPAGGFVQNLGDIEDLDVLAFFCLKTILEHCHAEGACREDMIDVEGE